MSFSEKVMEVMGDRLYLGWMVIGVNNVYLRGRIWKVEVELIGSWDVRRGGCCSKSIEVELDSDDIPENFRRMSLANLRTLGDSICPEGCLLVWDEYEA